MDMIKSLIVSTIVVLSIVAVFVGAAKIESNNKIQKNFVIAKDNFENSKLESALNLLESEPPKNIAQDYYCLKYDVLMNLNKIYEAETVAKKLVELDKKNAFNHYLLSLIYYNLGDNDKTEECLKNAIKYAPKNVDYKINLANVYANEWKNDKAIALFEEVKKTNPKYEVAWAGIATIYENGKNYKKALVYRKDAAEKFSRNVYDVYMLAELYNKMGDKKSAALYYEKTAKMDVNKESDAQEKYEKLTGKPLYMASVSTSQRIPALFVDNLIIIDALANGIKGRFLVDTGANASVVYERFLRKNKIHVEADGYGIYTLADGKRGTAPAFYTNIEVGTLNFYDDRVFILPDFKGITFDGIIGNDILAKSDFYVDRKNEVIIIKK